MRAVYLRLSWLLVWIAVAFCIKLARMPEWTASAECNAAESASAEAALYADINRLLQDNSELRKEIIALNATLAALRQTNERMLHELYPFTSPRSPPPLQCH